MEEKILHLGIGIPSLDTWWADFAISVISIITDIKSVPVPGYDKTRVSIINKRSSAIAQLRQDIVDEARKLECTHLLWVDSDQVFPRDTARRLLAHEKDVVACNIAVKRLPSLPTARSYVPKWKYTGDVVFTRPDSTGLEEVWRIGCGVMMTDMKIYDKLTKPYFNFSWNDVTGFVGEDWLFCQNLWEKGIKIYIDHDLSKEIGHIGIYSYAHSDVDHLEQRLIIKRPEEDEQA